MHLSDMGQRAWLVERYETAAGRIQLSQNDRHEILEHLTRSESFEKFLQKRYPGDKRFSLEGAEALIPLLHRVIQGAADLGAEEMVLGMAHRGRLNVLNNILGKSYEQIFTEFEDTWTEGFAGRRRRREVPPRLFRRPAGCTTGGSCTSRWPATPAILRPSTAWSRDAAAPSSGFAATQKPHPRHPRADARRRGRGWPGCRGRTAELSQLEGYTTGGTIHVVVNNLIGFTTLPEDAALDGTAPTSPRRSSAGLPRQRRRPRGRASRWRSSPSSSVRPSRRTSSSTCTASASTGTTSRTSSPSRSPCWRRSASRPREVLTCTPTSACGRGRDLRGDRQADPEPPRRGMLDQAQQTAAKSKPNDPTIDPGSARWAG
jgi:hypothetical protein